MYIIGSSFIIYNESEWIMSIHIVVYPPFVNKNSCDVWWLVSSWQISDNQFTPVWSSNKNYQPTKKSLSASSLNICHILQPRLAVSFRREVGKFAMSAWQAPNFASCILGWPREKQSTIMFWQTCKNTLVQKISLKASKRCSMLVSDGWKCWLIMVDVG